ncbi:adenylate/guanylate cyclase domain-containing protein [Okeania sp. SIO2B3]|uniref:adenylate/guanylate cyclase domain-containing protein n=1 Tax=Okeania sp. SIO2B3 TaxID=2607784 RepID=UPI0013C02D78|nr:adenylate/guanylate cyclase domain-containing protein [Okeania sp. SIO2B3]NET45123.1 PAS domain S-box protein [Okeania sp. SIO2B3]
MQKYTINVLLIEDDEDDFIIIDDILSEVESPTISLNWENTYEGGLAAIETGKYDVCLLDYRLGEKDGIELLKTAIDLNCQTPIILVTGQGDRELDLLAMKIGAADYLNKLEIREYTLERVIRYVIERNKNLIALKESQEKLQEAQKIPHLGNWELDLKTQKITWSDEVFRIFGLSSTQKQPTYPEFLEMFLPESRKLWSKNMALILEKTQKCECEYEIIRPDGTVRYLYTKTTLITNSNLESIGIFGTILDITKRQLAELEVKKIRKQEHLLSLVIDRIHQSLNLEEILETTVESVREFLQCDRVLIYRFLPNGHGVVEKESLAANCLSLLGMTIVDPCFPNSNILERYKQGYFSIISNINQSKIKSCYAELLTQFQVKANIVLPILITNETENKNHTEKSEINVWGLLIAHHCRENREWEISETDLLRRLAAQTAIAIQQAQLYQYVESLNQELTDNNLSLQQEITERKRAESEIRFLLETTQSINNADDFNSALAIILQSCCQLIDWDFSEAWTPNQDTNLLECSQGWCPQKPDLFECRDQSMKLTFSHNNGLPGRIFASQKSEWVEDFSIESKLAAIADLKTAFGVPIIVEKKVLAILIFFNKKVLSRQLHVMQLIEVVATQLGSLVQHKQVEESLRIAEQLYHEIVENAVDGIFQTTPSGRFISANMALAKMCGYSSPEELIKSIQDISRQVYFVVNRRQEFILAMKADNAVHNFESLVYCKDGNTIWISENARAVNDSQGKLLYYEGTVSNITERKIAQEALKFQKQQMQQLLLNILPAKIAQRLQTGARSIADSFDDVSVLFADLVGFTEFCSNVSAIELVDFLNLIFSEFDQLAQKYRLEKIKTIGDAYMVVGGLLIQQEDHLQAIANMALEMQACLERICVQQQTSLTLRIGIHVGPVVAGVIGQTKFIYDLWGDTVNIASRMESSGIDGEIQVTSVIYQRLKEKFVFEERGEISIKGKGNMTTYLLKEQVEVSV